MNIPLFSLFAHVKGRWHISSFEKSLRLTFFWHSLSKVFQTLRDYNLAWGLQCHSRLDDFDFVSKSQVCQKYKLQIACFGLLSLVVKRCMVATSIKKIMHNIICMTDAIQVSGHVKNFNFEIYWQHISDNCHTWHDSATHYALPVHTTFSDLDHFQGHSNVKQI